MKKAPLVIVFLHYGFANVLRQSNVFFGIVKAS